MLKTISVETNQRNDLVDITDKIRELVKSSRVKEGACIVFCPHTTAALTINENADPSVKKDIIAGLSRIVPENLDYEHIEGNSDSHIKSSLTGPSLSLIISNGDLVLGTWQGVYFCEFDGPRKRMLFIKIYPV